MAVYPLAGNLALGVDLLDNVQDGVIFHFNLDIVVFEPVILHVLELHKPVFLANQKGVELVIPVIDYDQIFLKTQSL